MTLATLAFLTARERRHRCPMFWKARERQGRNPCLWNRLREPVGTFAFPDWRTLFQALAGDLGKEDYVGLIRAGPQPNRSGHARTTPIPSTSYIFGCKSLIFGGPDFEWALHRGTFPRSLPPVSGLCHPPARRAAVFRVGWSRNGASFHPRPRLR